MFYIISENERYKTMKKLDYILGIVVVCSLGLLISHFYKLSHVQINLMGNTVYPGKRIMLGGGTKVQELLYYFFSWKLPFRDITTFSNNSEASSFFTLFPFIPFIFILVKRNVYEKFKVLKYLLFFLIFQMFWLFISFPQWFAKVTLLSYVQPKRLVIVFGLTCIYILIIFLASIKDIKYKCSFPIVFVVINLFFIIFLYNSNVKDFLGKGFLILTTVYINLIIYCLYMKKRKVSMLLIGIIVFISGFAVNPICQGLGSIYNNKLSSKIIISLNKSDAGTWLGINSIVYGDYLLANGVKSYNCVNYLPDYKKWNKIDKTYLYKNVYNRYAHIIVNLIEDKTNFVLVNKADLITLNLNYTDLLINTDIKYIMAPNKIDNLQKYKEISEIYHDKQSNIYVYKISRY